MCFVLMLTSMLIVNADEVEESSQGGGASASFGSSSGLGMSAINDYIAGIGEYASVSGRHSWTGELTVKMRLAVAAFALSQGIVFDNPATSSAILDFYNDLSYADKQKVHALSELIDNVDNAYKTIASFQKDVADYMTTLISSFFTHERYFSGTGSIDYGQSVSYNGQSSVDLSLADQIFFNTQSASDPSPNNHDCHVDYRISSGFVLRSYYHSYSMPIDIWSEFANLTPNSSSYYTILVPDNGDLCMMGQSNRTFLNNRVYSNLAFNFSNYRLTFQAVDGSDSFLFSFSRNYVFYSKSLYNSSTLLSYRISDINGKYAFIDRNYSVYNNLYFDTIIDAINYFLGQGGMSITEPFAVQEIDNTPDVLEIDEDKQTHFITQISNMSDDDVITIVIPTSTTYSNFVNQPSLLFDFSQDNLYDSSLNLPSSDGNKWANKFPFCLPFDIYHLFSNFSAEPEAPELHMLVLPANAFGMTNEAYYIDFDFADYNILVQILRFFIALGFVIWLIVITNKITK